jgi:hypothetical protein
MYQGSRAAICFIFKISRLLSLRRAILDAKLDIARSNLKRLVLIGLMSFALVGGPLHASSLPPLRRVNAPHFGASVPIDQTAVFWFGDVTPHENSTDVRVAYRDGALWVHVDIMDQYLWYDTTPSASTLTDWDAVTIYVDKRGNTGSTPTLDSYRFDGQLNWWEPRNNWQTAYRGNGTTWVPAPVTFTTWSNQYGPNAPPNVPGSSYYGWFIGFSIPFTSLGLSGPPPEGTIWGLGIKLHDRDSATGPMEPDKSWPEGMSPDHPASWGQLRFGLPGYSLASPVTKQGTTVIRQGLNGVTVQDAVVGGNTLCGGSLSDYFVQWGNLNYAHSTVFNVQNVEATSEWPCFSKAYITFPLDSLPTAKSIISATLTLHHSGNPGPPPGPAYIQVLSVDQSWDENTITWNNAPLARENLGGTWIPPVSEAQPYPGIPYDWDVSRAVAEAYAAGEPLRLAVYSSNSSKSNGRYFFSSDVEDLNAEGRPTLRVAWGAQAASVNASVLPAAASSGQVLTYTVSLLGTGNAMTLTNDLPALALISAPISAPSGSSGTISYDAANRRVIWYGALSAGTPATLTYPVTLLTSGRQVIHNTVILTDAVSGPVSSTATLIANGLQVYLPLTQK